MAGGKKRGNGGGTVDKLPSGRWRWRATVTLPSGESKRISGTARTKTEAQEQLSLRRADALRGQTVSATRHKLGDYLQEWHERRKLRQAAKYTVFREGLIRNHILPHLGQLPLAQVTPRKLEQFYGALVHTDERRPDTLGQPLSDSVRRQIHNLLHQMFDEAVRHELLPRNPTAVVRPTSQRKAAAVEGELEAKAWTEEEARKFYAVAREDRRGVMFCFMLATGMRVGEALGLRWENVDLDTGTVHIREALVSLGGKRHRTTPKTARSRRSIQVGGDALEILREMPKRNQLDKEAQGTRYVGSDSVFTTARGYPILPDNVYKLMKRLCKEAGVPYKGTHVLRHSFISIQGMRGTPVEVVSAHVGHSRASFTQDMYRTVFASEREALTLDFSEE